MSNDLFRNYVAEVKSRIREVSVEDYLKEVATGAKPVLIDVREASEVVRGHAPDAILISRGILEGEIEDEITDLSTPVVLSCASGNRSAFAAESLQRMGYTNVRSLAGGFKAWAAAGQPVVKS
ncbi:MAG: rhodanese-like domain-containing protein [Rariglobus sp.]